MRSGSTWVLRAEARDEAGLLLAYATTTWKLLKTAARAATPRETLA